MYGEIGSALHNYLYLLAALGLVLLNAFFVAAEFAIVKIRATRLETLAKSGSLFAASAQKAVEHLDAYLSATQLGITLASLGLGWIGEPAFAHLLRPLLESVGIWSPQATRSISIATAFLVITFLHIILGELAPKSLAIQRTETVVLSVSLPLRAFYILFYPALWMLNSASNAILRLFRIEPAGSAELAHSEEELRIILTESARSGALSGLKRRLLENIFNYTRRTAQQIMIPRAEIAYISLARTWEENLQVMRSTEHTRYPLCTLSLDHVIGMVHVKDLFHHGTEVRSGEDLISRKRDVLFVPETTTLDDLQRQFQQKRVHMAVVVDEYGGTAGLVTFEDVLEELVGEIQDEFDREQPKIEKTPEGELVDGLLLVSDVNGRLGLGLDEGEARTIGGYLTTELGRIARVGDRITINGGRELRVVEMKGRRVAKVLVAASQKPPPESAATVPAQGEGGVP
ncbi:MAG: hemolysin family protein [Candidatus Binatia bacterium]